MARGRMLDRSFVRSDKVNQLNRDTRLAYAMILPFVDREGRHVAEPLVLKATVFRWSDYTIPEIATAVVALARVGLIRLYADHDNAAILEVTRFHDHNSPNHKEAASDLPGPDGDDVDDVRDPDILAVTDDTPGHAPGNARATPGVNVNVNVNDNDNDNVIPSERDVPMKALARLKRTDEGSERIVRDLGGQLGWKFRHLNLAAQAVIDHGTDALDALRVTIKGADKRGAAAFRYFEAVLANPRVKQTATPDTPRDYGDDATAADLLDVADGNLAGRWSS